jgi:NADP-dependent 3-hydroxy acid dehydrogenase YdfG
MIAIAQRSFTTADQEAFAELTGDWNPMHMDEAVAKQTQAGACAVHGMHAALWMLEESRSVGMDLLSIARINVRFARFILVGQSVSVLLAAKDHNSAKIEARVDDQTVIAMTLGLGSRADRADAHRIALSKDALPLPLVPLEPAFDEMDSIHGELVLPPESDPSVLFPGLCEAFGVGWVGSMGLLSTVVGMVVPGLHSIFSGLSVALDSEPTRPANVAFRVNESDERFRLVTIAVAGTGLAGEITAFMRFPPVQAPGIDRVAAMVAPDLFEDRIALIIGGSRGIGANIAKLIAAGGGRVVLTYVASRGDAEAIEAEVNSHRGQSVCSAARYDALTPGDIPNLGELNRFTHVYFCATTKIGGNGTKVYSLRAFSEFCNVYVDGFHTLVQALLDSRPAGQPLTVLYPSSIFVTERPKRMTEYAMAKAAGEILCADLAKAHRNLKISMPRLPRILTDQTATVPPVPAADALEVMLPLLLAE